MSLGQEISQRDLRMHSREIMDAVEQGRSFTVTRDGREIGGLVPMQRKRIFVPADEFLAVGKGLGAIDPELFRADLDALADPALADPFTR